MSWPELIGFALEAAIGVQLVLFTAFLLASPDPRTPALYLLSAVTGGIAVLMAGNFLIASAGWHWFEHPNLFLDLLVPAGLYLYVRHMRHPLTAFRPLALVHALPATLGFVLWESGVMPSMDAYGIAVWTGYIGAAFWVFAANSDAYAPAPLRRLLAGLLSLAACIIVFRTAIALNADSIERFREGTAFLAILVAVLATSCLILFTALRYPRLLSVPASHVKYITTAADDADIDELERRLTRLLLEKKPYLDPQLSVSGLAALLDVPARSVSQLINARYVMNVSAYMNACRAEAAARALNDPAQRDKPVKTIMYDSGFRSKTAFTREFRRRFGTSPSEYRKALP